MPHYITTHIHSVVYVNNDKEPVNKCTFGSNNTLEFVVHLQQSVVKNNE